MSAAHETPVTTASEMAEVAVMERLLPTTALPISIPVDHGTECMSKALDAWAF